MDFWTISKEIRPGEFHAWLRKYKDFVIMSTQGTPTREIYTKNFTSKLDSLWSNRIQRLVGQDTGQEDLLVLVEKELKILFPISKRREVLFQCHQKQGQLASDYFS